MEFYVRRETSRWRNTSLEKRVGGKQTRLENHLAILQRLIIIKIIKNNDFFLSLLLLYNLPITLDLL